MKKFNFHTIKNVFFILAQLWKCSPGRVILSLVTTILSNSVEIVAGVLLLKYIINSIQMGTAFKEICIVLTIVMVSILLVFWFQDWYNNVFVPKSNQKISKFYNTIIFNKVKEIDLEDYDNTAFYDKYTRAINESESRAISVLNDFNNIIGSFFVLVSLISIFLTLDPWLIIFALTPILFSIPLSFIRNKMNYKYNMKKTLDERKLGYVKRALYLKEYAKEVKMTGISSVLLKMYDKSNNNLLRLIHKLGYKIMGLGFWETFNQIIIVMYATYIYLIYRIVVAKTLLIGDFVSLYNAVRSAELSLRRIIETFPRMHEHSLYIQNYRDFLNIKPKIINTENPLDMKRYANEIELKHVFFSYNGGATQVLKDISLRIKNKEKIAFVGRNGAGKSTLIKLIMRLYEPTQGEITYGGKNYSKFDIHEYYSSFGTVFQDFQLFNVSVAENILMKEMTTEEDYHNVIDILKQVHLYEKIQKSDDGIRSDVSKEFSEKGLIFSGGENQKIAIARAFVNSRNCLIFDEASSALDPISEYELNNLIIQLAVDKTVILISHRLSTTKDVDRIYYLEDGSILEQGSHDELMKLNGNYAKLFNIQLEQYTKKKTELEE